MSDVEIRSSGVVAVDTESLTHAARVLDQFRVELRYVADGLLAVASRMSASPDTFGDGLALRAWNLVDAARDLADPPERLAGWLRETAAVYEAVELQAQRAAAALAGEKADVARIDALLAAIDARHPGATGQATAARLWRDATWAGDIAGQLQAGIGALTPGGAGLGLVAWALAHDLRTLGTGRIDAGTKLRGAAAPIRLEELTPTATLTAAPATLAGVAQRIPDGQARIRVERYAMPDGSRQFAVYVAGTRAGASGGSDPFDWTSNFQLHDGRVSSSFVAVEAALAHSGAEPGDIVHAAGHSQGAMIGAYLAVEGDYDVRTLIGLGSPVDPLVDPRTLSIEVRHTDDPVVALTGGGRVDPVGAAGSFVAERSFDPAPGIQDLGAPAHRLDGYIDTTRLLDESSDPRMGAIRSTLAELATATDVRVWEYDAERVSPSSADAG